jgi:hypothetical protein
MGTLDEVAEDAVRCRLADEVCIDLNLNDWFTSTDRMLETAEELYQRTAGP